MKDRLHGADLRRTRSFTASRIAMSQRKLQSCGSGMLDRPGCDYRRAIVGALDEPKSPV